MSGRIRSIQSPGVELTEIDKSQVAPSIAGTHMLIPGYADKGENFEIIVGNSMDQFLQTYGPPTTEAERYFYYAAKDVVTQGGTAITMKLPYDNDISKHYKAVTLTLNESDTLSPSQTFAQNSMNAFKTYAKEADPATNIVKNTHITKFIKIEKDHTTSITSDRLEILKDSESAIDFPGTWDFMLVDKSKSILKFHNFEDLTTRTCEGMFVTFVDYADGLYGQRITSTYTPRDTTNYAPDSDVFNTVTDITFDHKDSAAIPILCGINSEMMSTKLSDKFMYTSFSEDLSKKFPTIDTVVTKNESGSGYDSALSTDYLNFVAVVVGYASQDTSVANSKIKLEIYETHVGSLVQGSTDPRTGRSNYICDIINGNSATLKMFDRKTFDVNTGIYTATAKRKILTGMTTTAPLTTFSNITPIPPSTIDPTTLKLIGFDEKYDTMKKINHGTISADLDKALQKLSNIDEYTIDAVVDVISSIAQHTTVY
jgi:hypothetical protein